jgi:hypothetical protein
VTGEQRHAKILASIWQARSAGASMIEAVARGARTAVLLNGDTEIEANRMYAALRYALEAMVERQEYKPDAIPGLEEELCKILRPEPEQ